MNTNEAVAKLIEAGKNLFGQNLASPLDKMFKDLYFPLQDLSLEAKPFYNYQYQYCPSEVTVPKDKEVGKVYWFIDKDGAVCYQVAISNDPMQLHQGQLPENFPIPAPEIQYEMKKVTTQENGLTRTKTVKQRMPLCKYTINNSELIQTRVIKIENGDDDNAIKEKIRVDYLKQIIKQPLTGSLERKMSAALKGQKILPANEADFPVVIASQYREMITTEENISKFVSELIAILEDESFKAIFQDNPKAIELIGQMLSIAREIRSNQKSMLQLLDKNVNNSTEVINCIQQAYGRCNQKNHQEMAALITSLEGEISKKPECLTKVKDFGSAKKGLLDSTSAFFFLSDSSLSAGFSAQLILRRQMTFQAVIKSFNADHPQIRTLEPIFNALMQTNSIANRVQSIKEKNRENAKAMMELLQNSGMSKGSLGFNCFQLMVQVLVLLEKERDPSLDWNKIMGQRKETILLYLKKLEVIIAFSKSMGRTNLDPTSVSNVMAAIENNPSITFPETVMAITSLFNILSDNSANLTLTAPQEILVVDDIENIEDDFIDISSDSADIGKVNAAPPTPEDIDDFLIISSDPASSGNTNVAPPPPGSTLAPSNSSAFFHQSTTHTRSSTEKPEEKNQQKLITELTESRLFQARTK